MADFEKINDQELENAAGGQYGQANIKHVANLQSGYNGDTVQIIGSYVQGTTFSGAPATYVWVFVPKTGVSGYVNAAFLA